jgi:hypothetical protein
MTNIIFVVNEISISNTGDWRRPMFIKIDGTFTIGKAIRNCQWCEAIEIINEHFPGVEFRGEWDKNICRFIQIENAPVLVEDPECPLFFLEV